MTVKRSLRLAVQDAALSRLKHEFDSRRERQLDQYRREQPPSCAKQTEQGNETLSMTFVVTENCIKCKYNKICEGPWKKYPEIYGWDEFKPIIK